MAFTQDLMSTFTTAVDFRGQDELGNDEDNYLLMRSNNGQALTFGSAATGSQAGSKYLQFQTTTSDERIISYVPFNANEINPLAGSDTLYLGGKDHVSNIEIGNPNTQIEMAGELSVGTLNSAEEVFVGSVEDSNFTRITKGSATFTKDVEVMGAFSVSDALGNSFTTISGGDATFGNDVHVSGTLYTKYINHIDAGQDIHIGRGARYIYLGDTGTTLVMDGFLTTINTTNTDIVDKNITLNKNGVSGTQYGVGLTIEVDGVTGGYLQTRDQSINTADNGAWEFLATNPSYRGNVILPLVNEDARIVLDKLDQTIAGQKTFSSVTTVSNTTNSTNTVSGALVVSGGVGIALDVNVGGKLNVGDQTTLESLVVTNSSLLADTTVGGTFAVSDNAFFSSNVSAHNLYTDGEAILQTLSVTGGVIVNGTSTLAGAVVANSSLSVGTDLTVIQSIFANVLSVTGATDLNTLLVQNESSFDGLAYFSSNVDMSNDLTVSKNVTVNKTLASKDLQVTGASLLNTLNVTGTSSFTGAASFVADVTMGHNLLVQNNATVVNKLTANEFAATGTSLLNTLSVSGTATIQGFSTFENSVNVAQNVIVGSNVDVSNAVNTKILNATGASTLNSLSVSGTGQFDSNVTFSSEVDFDSNINAAQNINVAHAVTTMDLTATGTSIVNNLTVTGTSSFSGQSEFDASVGVAGNVVVVGGIDVGQLLSTNNLEVSGSSSLNTLSVSGVALFTNTAAFDENVEFKKDVTVDQNLNVLNTLSSATFAASGMSTLNQLTVTGAATFTRDSDFQQNVDITQNLSVGLIATVGQRLETLNLTSTGAASLNTLGVSGASLFYADSEFRTNASVLGSMTVHETMETNNLTATGASNLEGSLTVTGQSEFNSTSSFNDDVVMSNNLSVSGNVVIEQVLNSFNIESTGSTNLNTLAVSGASSFGGDVDVSAKLSVIGNDLEVGGSSIMEYLFVNSTLTKDFENGTYIDSNGHATFHGSVVQKGITGANVFDGTVSIGGSTVLEKTTDSSSISTGALIVKGGVGIAKKLYVGGLAFKPVSQMWSIGSDKRIKENIRDADELEMVESLKKINLKRYKFIDSYQNFFDMDSVKRTQLGVIANDLKETHPHLVHAEDRNVAGQDLKDFLTIDMSEEIFELIGVCQHLLRRVQDLEERLEKQDQSAEQDKQDQAFQQE